MLRAIILCNLIPAASPAWALQLKDLYSMNIASLPWMLTGE